MNFNTTEIDSTEDVIEYVPDLGYWDTVQESFKNFQSVNLSNSKDKHYKEIMGTNSAEWITNDPNNEALYSRMANYDVRDIEKLEALYEEGKLDKEYGYAQVNPFNMDVFLAEDFLKFKTLQAGVTEGITADIKAKATDEFYTSQANLAMSDHWSAEMLGTVGGALTDVKTIQTLPLGTWKAGGTVLQNASRAMAEEMGIEALAQLSIAPEIYSFKKELGIKTSIMEEATTAVTSIVGAGLFRGVGSATFDLTSKGFKALKLKDPELAAKYDSIAKSQTTDNLEEHAMNLQRVEFDEVITSVKNPNEAGEALNKAEPIPEVPDNMIFYHGTDEVFDKFDIEKAGSGNFGKGIYLAEDQAKAGKFGREVMTTKIKDTKLFDTEDMKTAIPIYKKFLASQGRSTNIKETNRGLTLYKGVTGGTKTKEEFNAFLKNEGYEGLKGKTPAAGKQVVLFGDDKVSIVKELNSIIKKKRKVTDREQQIIEAKEPKIGGSEDDAKEAVKQLFRKDTSEEARYKKMSKEDIIQQEKAYKEDLLRGKPKDMSDEDWIEAQELFGATEKVVDYDNMQFVAGKNIDGDNEFKTYKAVKDELAKEDEYLRGVERCLL